MTNGVEREEPSKKEKKNCTVHASSLKELGIMVIIPTDDTNYTLNPLLARCNVNFTKLQKFEKQGLIPKSDRHYKKRKLHSILLMKRKTISLT